MQGFFCAPLFDERCNYNTMIEYLTIRKIHKNQKGES